MRRRTFITLLGGAAVWPLAARGQEPVPVVGLLHTRPIDDRAPEIAALRRGLAQQGYEHGRSVAIEYRWAEQRDRLSALVAELIAKPVAVIVGNSIAAAAAKAATTSVPIVFATGT